MGTKRTLKRTYHVTANSPVAKRLRIMERQIALNKAETKCITFNTSSEVAVNAALTIRLTDIAQGTGVTERIGNKIRIMRIEVRGASDYGLDYYLIQGHAAIVPTANAFGGSQGAYILNNYTNNRYTEWAHFKPRAEVAAVANPVKFARRFNMMQVNYDGPNGTDGEKNNVFLVILNRSAAQRGTDVNVRVWYKDN